MCQRPKRASSISTLNKEDSCMNQISLCQRPKRASSISTEGSSKIFSKSYHCVNALNGLLLFLQYPLESRINTGFQAPSFASICLNFLIVTVFWKFFGMFTVCSYSIMHLPFLMFPDSPITDRNRRITVL